MPLAADYVYGIGWQGLEFAERRALPVDRAQDDRDDLGFAAFVPLHSSFHLDAIAVVGVYKVWADQQQDDIGGVQMLLDLSFPFGTCADIAVIPDFDQPLSLERTQVRFEFVQQWFVFSSITEEDFYCRCHRRFPQASIAGLALSSSSSL